jgi:predicted nucleotidyltransferase
VVETINRNRLGDKLGVDLLDHVHDFLLDKLQVVGVTRRGAANDIVDLDIIVVLANATTIHGVGELDEDRVLLHDALDVLTSNADDALVVLVRHVE